MRNPLSKTNMLQLYFTREEQEARAQVKSVIDYFWFNHYKSILLFLTFLDILDSLTTL